MALNNAINTLFQKITGGFKFGDNQGDASLSVKNGDIEIEGGATINDGDLLIGNSADNKLELVSSGGWIPISTIPTRQSADDPIYVLRFAADMTNLVFRGTRVHIVQGGSDWYFIVHNVGTYTGGNTDITIYGGTLYDVSDTSIQPITTIEISYANAPVGFDINPSIWSVTVTPSGSQSSATKGTWYNLGSTQLTIPIGVWILEYNVVLFINNSGGDADIWITVSNANNTENDNTYTNRLLMVGTNGSMAPVSKSKIFSTASKVTRYLNAKSESNGTSTIVFQQNGPGYFRVVDAYL